MKKYKCKEATPQHILYNYHARKAISDLKFVIKRNTHFHELSNQYH